jgi:hypothetical protein
VEERGGPDRVMVPPSEESLPRWRKCAAVCGRVYVGLRSVRRSTVGVRHGYPINKDAPNPEVVQRNHNHVAPRPGDRSGSTGEDANSG